MNCKRLLKEQRKEKLAEARMKGKDWILRMYLSKTPKPREIKRKKYLNPYKNKPQQIEQVPPQSATESN